jgi:hypothetical protein
MADPMQTYNETVAAMQNFIRLGEANRSRQEATKRISFARLAAWLQSAVRR